MHRMNVFVAAAQWHAGQGRNRPCLDSDSRLERMTWLGRCVCWLAARLGVGKAEGSGTGSGKAPQGAASFGVCAGVGACAQILAQIHAVVADNNTRVIAVILRNYSHSIETQNRRTTEYRTRLFSRDYTPRALYEPQSFASPCSWLCPCTQCTIIHSKQFDTHVLRA